MSARNTLAPEPEHDPDAVFRNFMRHNLTRAADHFTLTIVGEPLFGWRLRSISARAADRAGTRWLRIVSQETLDHNRSNQSILLWVWIVLGLLGVRAPATPRRVDQP